MGIAFILHPRFQNYNHMENKKIVIVGGGAAGFFCAIHVAELHPNWEITILEKGKEVAIEGKLTSRSYDDKDGTKKYVTEVVVNELLLLGNK